MKVRKKRSRVEGVLAYVPFQAIENLVIDASDITPGDLPAARRVSGISSGTVHMTLPATSGSSYTSQSSHVGGAQSTKAMWPQKRCMYN